MATVREIYQYLDGLAPFSLQMDFDNAGFLVGRGDRTVDKVLVSLDITERSRGVSSMGRIPSPPTKKGAV